MPTGAIPPNPDTLIGRLRILLGDITYTSGEGSETGEYAVFGDSELQAFLEEGSTPLRAAAIATRRLALEYSASAQSIRTDDIAIDLRSRGKDLIEVARSFTESANIQDAAQGIGPGVKPGDGPDVFLVAPSRRIPRVGDFVV